MKVLLISYLLIALFSSYKTADRLEEYDIEGFYKGIDPSSGTIVLTKDEEIKEAETILVPMKLDAGKYSISISKKADDLYKIDDKNIYIKTRYCYEYATGEAAILKVESAYGYTKGKIIF